MIGTKVKGKLYLFLSPFAPVMPAKAGIPLMGSRSGTPAFAGVTALAELPLKRLPYVMPLERQPAVYILASRYRGTLYVGVTSQLWSRISDHKNAVRPGFTSRYDTNLLVWYEHSHTMDSAITREKQIKAWKRAWKIELIEKMNPSWRDLHDEIDSLATLVDD